LIDHRFRTVGRILHWRPQFQHGRDEFADLFLMSLPWRFIANRRPNANVPVACES
jgi:hypothetical protein